MTDFNEQEKLRLNRMVALCREYRFNESRQEIIKSAGLPIQSTNLPITELRKTIDARIENKVTSPLVGEMLRIESTFRYVRDIETYNQSQAAKIIANLDKTIPYLDNKNLWFVTHKLNQIYHFSGQEHFRYKLTEQTKPLTKFVF